MDAITLVAYTFEIGSAVVERCESVKQCHSESSRIAVRTLRVLGCLEDASKQFSNRVEFEASLTELKKALEEARDLVTRCQKAKGVSARIGAFMRANTLKERLVRVEADLERVAADMQLPMLTDIRRAVECINERESEASRGADGGLDAEMLEQAVRDAIRKELNATTTTSRQDGRGDGGRRVDEIIKDNLSRLYEAEAAVAEDHERSAPAEVAGGGPLLCSGHKEECALRTTRKAGANQGRKFYCCPRTNKQEQCKSFTWADERGGGKAASNGETRAGEKGGDGRVCKVHREPCLFLRVKKEGPNKDRRFYTCRRQGDNKCSSFSWADEAHAVAAADGTRGDANGGGGSSANSVARGANGRKNDSAGGSGCRERLCEGHQEPCRRRITQKEGPNKGRPFFGCPRTRSESCNHFEWEKSG
ncbi:unnamed protein product [Scytosiphon promiscuus]